MYHEDYQVRREHIILKKQISALKYKIRGLERAKVQAELAYQQEIEELRNENNGKGNIYFEG